MTAEAPLLSVAIIVLNWNGRADTLRCVASILASAPGVTVIVVDNGSSDGSAAALRAEWPRLTVLETNRNLGYAGGNNVGLRYALEDGHDVIGVLNNDTVVSRDFLEPLLELIRDAPERTVVSPIIDYMDGPGIWFGGSSFDQRRGIYVHEQVTSAPPSRAESPALTGCALFASRSVWERVGLFDESYFLIFEDAQWSRRAVQAGCTLLLDPRSRIQHAVSATFSRGTNHDSTYYFLRNGLRLLGEWRSPLRQRVCFWLDTTRHGIRLRHGRTELTASTRATVQATIDAIRRRGGSRYE